MRDYGYMTASMANIDATTKKPPPSYCAGWVFFMRGERPSDPG